MMTYTLSKELLVDEVTGDTSEIYRGRAYMNGDLVDTTLPGN